MLCARAGTACLLRPAPEPAASGACQPPGCGKFPEREPGLALWQQPQCPWFLVGHLAPWDHRTFGHGLVSLMLPWPRSLPCHCHRSSFCMTSCACLFICYQKSQNWWGSFLTCCSPAGVLGKHSPALRPLGSPSPSFLMRGAWAPVLALAPVSRVTSGQHPYSEPQLSLGKWDSGLWPPGGSDEHELDPQCLPSGVCGPNSTPAVR